MFARFATALVLLAIFCGGLLLLPNDYWALFLLAFLWAASFEWGALAGYSRAGQWLFAALTAASCLALQFYGPARALYVAVYWVAFVFWLVVAPVWLARRAQIRNPVALGLAGWVVLVPTWLALVVLQTAPGELIAVMGIVWVADTAAYFAGRRLGRHPLAPRVSPGKTWEGVAGACLAVAVYYSVLWLIFNTEQPPRDAAGGIVLFAAATAMSVQGDLFESWMKRQAGVKESGILLPGHGGVLDRIDALTASMPLAALWFHYFDQPGFL